MEANNDTIEALIGRKVQVRIEENGKGCGYWFGKLHMQGAFYCVCVRAKKKPRGMAEVLFTREQITKIHFAMDEAWVIYVRLG
jgi:hypothetical protein